MTLPRITLVALACALLAPAAAAADDFTVNNDTTGPGPAGADCANPDFSTLQAAEDDIQVDPGDRILVCAGAYVEGGGDPAVTDTKGLIWKGAQAGVDARDRTVPLNDESIVNDANGAFDILDSDATVDGFFVDTGNFGVSLAEGDGHTVANNIIEDAGNGVYTDSNGISTTVIEQNRIENTEDGIHSDEVLSNVGIEDNLLTDLARGIVIHPEEGADDVDIAGNTIDDVDTGMELEDATGFSIFDNSLTGFEVAILLFGPTEEITIENNHIGGSGPGVETSGNGLSGVGIVFGEGEGGDLNEDVQMIGNTITDNELGILIEDASTGGGIEAHFNRIAGNGQIESEGIGPPPGGIVNEDALEQLDATNNWFGCNEGPNEDDCDSVEGNVDFDPWLVMDVKSKTSQVKPNQSTKVRASLNQNSDGDDLVPCLFPRGTEIDFTSTKKGEVDPSSDGTNRDCKATTKFFAGPTEGKAKVRALLDEERVKDVIRIDKP